MKSLIKNIYILTKSCSNIQAMVAIIRHIGMYDMAGLPEPERVSWVQGPSGR
jgi:hypothetical protein